MAVNGILEGYLSIYGWQVYSALFLLLAAVGLVLYPLARLIVDLALAHVEGRTDPVAGARTLIAKSTVYVLVLVLGMVPVVSLQVTSMQVQDRCEASSLAQHAQAATSLTGEGYGLTTLQDTRVPLLPYLAMLLASGFNAILYQATPCLLDLTDLSFAMNTLDFSAADEPNELRSNVERFERECGGAARRLTIAMLNGEHGPDMRTYLEDQLAAHAETLEQKQKQLAYPASKFYQEVFYKPCAGGADPNTAAGRLCIMRPLRAENPVPGFPYDAARDSDASRYQAATGQGLPTCDEWWNDAENGLKGQLIAAAKKGMQKKMAFLTITNQLCWDNLKNGFFAGLSGFGVCAVLANSDTKIEGFDNMVVEKLLMSNQRHLLDAQMPELGLGSALIGAGLFAFTDVAQQIATQAASYWTSIYVMKIGSRLLQPFVLMTIFILWGVFLVIGEMRGLVLIKGLMLIFVLSILPGLWNLADLIDDQLFLALYPGAPPVSLSNIPAELLADHSTIERFLLTFTTTVFYVIFPLLMLYVVAEAGGPGSGPTIASSGINNPAQTQGGIAGSAASGAKWRNPFKSKRESP
ncbi:MAG TPA: conjugal transfer protein TraG N-terminal domain-containing protein [Candidatus Competibacter sp.]|nr:conjugal transfer protein TraG N-terminal domain-containing protein [Candidatus Competibacter sp.]